jgi:hypothetical protein
MSSREKFEEHCNFTPAELSTLHANPEYGEVWGYQYVSLRTQTAWEAWQAAYRVGQEAMRERAADDLKHYSDELGAKAERVDLDEAINLKAAALMLLVKAELIRRMPIED